MLDTQKCYCPYCGELIELVLDPSMGEEQNYIEDCFVCCRPMVLKVTTDMTTGEIFVTAMTENE